MVSGTYLFRGSICVTFSEKIMFCLRINLSPSLATLISLYSTGVVTQEKILTIAIKYKDLLRKQRQIIEFVAKNE